MEYAPRTRSAIIQLSDLPKMRARNTNHCAKCEKELIEGDAIVKKIRSSRSNEKRSFYTQLSSKMLGQDALLTYNYQCGCSCHLHGDKSCPNCWRWHIGKETEGYDKQP